MKQKMSKILFLTCVMCVSTSSIRTEFINPYYGYEKMSEVKKIEPEKIELDITSALIYVESRGNDIAYNPSEDAVGCLQIRPIMVREVNRILKKTNREERFDLEDRWDREKSLEMFHIWRNYHHPSSSDEVIARNWNGGPNGFNKESTLKYWKKVRGRLEIES
jgi:hypothetical protein